MQIRDGKTLFSASDLVNYLECEHLTPLPRAAADDQVKFTQDKGYDEAFVHLQSVIKEKSASL